MSEDFGKATPPERLKLIMGATGPRIWWWEFPDPSWLPPGERIEYIRAASAPSPAATGEVVAYQFRAQTRGHWTPWNFCDADYAQWIKDHPAGGKNEWRALGVIEPAPAAPTGDAVRALLAARDEYARLMGRHVMPAKEMKKHDDLVREARNRLAAEAVLYCHKIASIDPAAPSQEPRHDAQP